MYRISVFIKIFWYSHPLANDTLPLNDTLKINNFLKIEYYFIKQIFLKARTY